MAIALVAIGVIRGATVSLVSHLSPYVAFELTALNVVIALAWLPVTLLAMWIIDAPITTTNRAITLLALGVASILVEPWLAVVLRHAGAPSTPFIRRLIGRSDTNALFYIAIIGACFAVQARRRQIASELATARVQAAAAGTQLHVLTLQLHPHFLFNALNLISQLAYESVESAQRAVGNLRALLVESLRHAGHREVTLGDELSFLRAYLEIQQARFRDRLRVTIDAPKDVERGAVPHLVLQPVVENAIVHGVAPRASAGSVEVSARRVNDRMILSVDDDGGGIPPEVKYGVGLTNTRLRLDELFGADHRLTIAPRKPHGTSVTIDIPFREPSADDSRANEEVVAPSESTDATRSIRVPSWLPIVAGWAAIAMIWTELGALPTPNRSPAFDYQATLVAYMINVGMWIALTPIVVRLARRFDLGARPSLRTILAHAGMSLFTAIVHTGGWLLALRGIGSPMFRQSYRSVFGWAIWDIAAYCAIVALATLLMFSARFRDSRVQVARAQARLALARVASLRLRLQPRVLLTSLDALARVIAEDAEAAEAAIARIGDLLRMLLSRSDQELVSLGDELQLLEAYLDVVGAPDVTRRDAFDPLCIAEAADELVPAMLLPSLAASFSGALQMIHAEVGDGRLNLIARSGGSVDDDAIRECLARLRSLYDGAERVSIEKDAAGRTIVELSLPRKTGTLISSEIYDLATA